MSSISRLSFLKALLVFLLLALPVAVSAQTPSVVLRVTDTVASSGTNNVLIPVYLDNYEDEISGIDITFLFDRPDLITITTEPLVDSQVGYWQCGLYNFVGDICKRSINSLEARYDGIMGYDSVVTRVYSRAPLAIDTTGTLLSGWEHLEVQYSAGPPASLRVLAIADLFTPPITVPIPPQQGGVLFRIVLDLQAIPDTAADQLLTIEIKNDHVTDLGLATDLGNNLIGVHPFLYEDTSCYLCQSWLDANCLSWDRVTMPPFDTCKIDSVYFFELDTTEVVVIDGFLTISPICCIGDRGNVNNDREDKTNVSDITFLSDYLFGMPTGPEPACYAEGNVNGDDLGRVNISDLAYLLAYLFQIPSGPPPPACQ